jgi:CHASE2 domain-containing sensor protein/nucleoside phosphorylase
VLKAVILTAIEVEYLSVQRHLQDIRHGKRLQGEDWENYECWEFGSENRWRVWIKSIGPTQANTSAETAVALEHFKPNVTILVGVAGGIKEKSVDIGDVIAATHIYNYESGKASIPFRSRIPSHWASNYLRDLATRIQRTNSWIPIPTDECRSIMQNTPKALLKPLASGDKLITSTDCETYRIVREFCEDAVAVEMEGFSFLKAVHKNGGDIDAIVVRGISDLIDNKDEDNDSLRQQCAADYASAFAFELLSQFRLMDRTQQKKALRNKAILISGLYAILIPTVIFCFRSLGSFGLAEAFLYDRSLSNRPVPEKLDPNIVVIELRKEDSVIRDGLNGETISDKDLLELLKKISDLKPATIGAYILLDKPRVPDNEKYLREYKTLVEYIKKQNTTSGSSISVPCQQDYNNGYGFQGIEKAPVSGNIAPVNILDKNVGFSNMDNDPDGIVRRHALADLHVDDDQCKSQNSFALTISLEYLKDSLENNASILQLKNNKKVRIETLTEDHPGFYNGINGIEDYQRILLNYRNNESAAQTITLADLQKKGKELEGKIVLVGYSFVDTHKTPYGQTISGVALNAHMISQFVNYAHGKRSLIHPYSRMGLFSLFNTHDAELLLFWGVFSASITSARMVSNGFRKTSLKQLSLVILCCVGSATIVCAVALNHPFAPVPLFVLPLVPILLITFFTPVLIVITNIPRITALREKFPWLRDN